MSWRSVAFGVVAMLAACGPQRTLEVGDKPTTLDQADPESFDWSNSPSLGLSPTGSHMFPAPLTLRIRVWDACGDNDECYQRLVSASVKAVSGAACTVTIPTSCSGTACLTELRLDGLGNCLVAVHAKVADGDTQSTCWYKAEYEADDPFDDKLFAMYESKTDGQVEACSDDL